MVDWRADINIVGLSDCVASVGRLEMVSRIRWPNEFLDRAAEIVKTNIEDKTPVQSGKLKASWVIDEMPDRREIFSTENYGHFQNDGTKPSPGRYVKAIDRRLVNPPGPGVIYHGTRGTKALERGLMPLGAKRYKSMIKEALKHFGKEYKKEIRSRKKHFDFETTLAQQMRDIKHEASFSSRVYGTRDLGTAFEYAESGPEKIRRALETVGIYTGEINRYMDMKFGHPIVLQIRGIKPLLGQHYGDDGGIAEEMGMDLILGKFVSKEHISRISRKTAERAGLSDEELSKAGNVKQRNIGMHPGVPATHFFDNAVEDADREIDAWFTEFANGIGWA